MSTIQNAACIYVVKDGEIVESGVHDELLLKEDGVYRQLHDIQFNTDETAVLPVAV
jgi:ABC-type multidrug transport system fused ATPase/permease subunit